VLNDRWFGYVYLKNLDKQHRRKLVVPRLVNQLAASYDDEGRVCLDNVDVGGILTAEGTDPWFLLGILNAPVADFVFRRVSKPFRGDYLSANRQFIKDLPIPHADATAQATVAAHARELQRLHSERRRVLNMLTRRLNVRTRARPPEWLFHGLLPAPDFALDAPATLTPRERIARGRSRRDAEIARRAAAVGAALRPGARLSAILADGELTVLAEGLPALDRVFVTAAEASFVHAVWRWLAAVTPVTEALTGSKLCDLLRCVPPATDPALVESVVALGADLDVADAGIAAAEAALNDLVLALYRLTPEERAMVLAG
jgi:hypothetical protein